MNSISLQLRCTLLGVLAVVLLASGNAVGQAPDEATDATVETGVGATTETSSASSDESIGGGMRENEPGGFSKYDTLLASLTIFVLAVFVGFEVITKVPPTLHTPLMSGSNAISGITIVGAILATGYGTNWFVALVGAIALILATINVVGGFLVTHRMLEMFKKKK